MANTSLASKRNSCGLNVTRSVDTHARSRKVYSVLLLNQMLKQVLQAQRLHLSKNLREQLGNVRIVDKWDTSRPTKSTVFNATPLIFFNNSR